MFDSLTDRLSEAFRNLRGQARLDEKNIQDGLREVRMALLEADVNFKVVKDFVDRVKERALGADVLKSLTPGQQVVKIVHDELVELLGGSQTGLDLKRKPVTIMMVGLQGSGKTTTASKLANLLRSKHKLKPYLVPADVYRPAAIEQLHVLAKQLGVPAYPSTTDMNPVDICADALKKAAEAGCDAILFDTAGRLHVDEPLMQELSAIKERCKPVEILFVADAMTGQDAVTVAEAFDKRLGVTGVVLTKMDGDARGGAALSIKSVTGKPLKFVGVGEKLSDLEPFHPDRAAQRILGMGDVMTLIEKAQDTMEAAEAEKLAAKMQQAKFDLEDFLTQMRRMRKIGSLESILKLIPGMGGMMKKLGDMQVPEKEIDKAEAIINSMTKKERREPAIINPSRRERIAKGCGKTVGEVNALIKNFEQMNKMMQQMLGGGGKAPQMPKMPKIPGMPAGYTMPGTKPQGKLSPSMMQNSMAQGMPDMGALGGMGGFPEMPQMQGEGKKQLSKKTLAERKKKKLNKKQRNKR
ncbi:MAG TPA: signal recognition particle protein [Humidesulfovibrio sp.]|uniref:signal recognition particle protein n=1 Tax=Humidesulfovibrio sp. TaxID=2910988 RepID=UPI002C787D01|nr:signal recognition particle protein [Humidesulfovibrio sp.]HWR05156.1 signal recognition particle protein [Humidesulfovibrio sp.]